MDRGAWRAMVREVNKGWTWLSDWRFCFDFTVPTPIPLMFHLRLCLVLCSTLLLHPSLQGVLTAPQSRQQDSLSSFCLGCSSVTYPPPTCIWWNFNFSMRPSLIILLKTPPHPHILINSFPDSCFFIALTTKSLVPHPVLFSYLFP